MTSFEVDLSPEIFGGEILVRLARARQSGILSWDRAKGDLAQLLFRDGRPLLAAHGKDKTTKRQQVVSLVRNFAVTLEGNCKFKGGAGDSQALADLKIDTLGEVLVATLRMKNPAQLQQLWAIRSDQVIEPASAFDQLSSAVAKVGGQKISQPAAGTSLGSLVVSASPQEQLSWFALLALGAIKVINTSKARQTTLGIPRRRTSVATMPRTDAVHDSHAQPAYNKDQGIPPSDQRPAAPAATKPTSGRHPRPGGRRVKTQRATLQSSADTPKDPKARKLLLEIRQAFQKEADQTHYELIDVSQKSSVEGIRRAYFKLAKKWHSDAFSGLDLPSSTLHEADHLFHRLEEAYRVLTDEAERQTYDYVLDRAAKGLPTDPKIIMEAEGLFSRGEKMVHAGHAAGALESLKKAVELNPGEAEFWIYYGYALHSAKGTDAAVEAYEHINKGLGMDDKLAAGYEFRGRIARVEGDFEAAHRDLRKALKIDRKLVSAKRELRLLEMRQSSGAYTASKSGLGGFLNKMFKG